MTSESAQSACLKLPEIISLIVENSGHPPLFTTEDRVNLRSIALTCKDFMDPAFNQLWKIQSSLSPLALTLPQRVVEGRRTGEENRRVTVARIREGAVLRPEDWERVSYYAPKIKSLQWAGRDYATEDVWHLLTAFRPPSLSYLLPNLAHLTLDSSPKLLYNMRTLLSPSISHLDMRFRSNMALSAQSTRVAFFNMLPELCLHITTLTLDSLPVEAALSVDIAESMSKLKLEILCCDNLRPSILEHTTRISTLRTLALAGIGPGILTFDKLNCLPAIRKIVYEGPDSGIGPVSELLQSISSPYLHSVMIGTPSNHTDDAASVDWGGLFQHLSRFGSTLQHLTIRGGLDGSSTSGLGVRELKLKVIKPLSTLHSLVYLRLDHVQLRSLSVTAKQVQELSTAWPNLIDLTTNWPIDFDGLVSFVDNCVHLRTLSFCLHPDTIPIDFRDRLRAARRNNLLESLGIGGSSRQKPPVDSVKVAVFLTALFPKLTSIHRDQGVGLSFQNSWKEVGRHIIAIRQALEIRDDHITFLDNRNN